MSAMRTSTESFLASQRLAAMRLCIDDTSALRASAYARVRSG
jgi:hypothetical protein